MTQANPTMMTDALRALQGSWRQTASEVDGVPNPEDEFGAGPRLDINDNRFVVTREDGEVVIKGTFVIDASRNPATIDWTDTVGADAGETFPAIYKLQGDSFTFCAADDGQPRPEQFGTHAGSGHVLRVHRRQTSDVPHSASALATQANA